jgi:hypothetical protein
MNTSWLISGAGAITGEGGAPGRAEASKVEDVDAVAGNSWASG